MSHREHDQRHITHSNSGKVSKNVSQSSKLARVVEYIHSAHMLNLLSAFCLVLLGITTVIVSLTGLIHPLWLSGFLVIFGSIAIVLGIYQFYSRVIKNRGQNHLIQEAMRRTMSAQN